MDLVRWTKDLSLPEGAPVQAAPPVATAAAPPPTPAASAIASAMFHVELVPTGDHRDLKIRRVSGAPTLNYAKVGAPSAVPVKITTEPPGAELTVDGDAAQRCQSPCVLSVAPARQAIHIQLEGYRTEMRAVDVKAGGTELSITLEHEFGMVEFQGTQGGTPVVFDGKEVAAQVPATVRVPVGKYEIRTMQEGKILNRQDVEVTPLSKSVITVKKP